MGLIGWLNWLRFDSGVESIALWLMAVLKMILMGLSCGDLLLIPVHLFELCLSVAARLIVAWMTWMSIGGIAASMSSAGIGVVLIAPVMVRFALLSSFLIFSTQGLLSFIKGSNQIGEP